MIQGFGARLDPAEIGLPLAMLVSMLVSITPIAPTAADDGAQRLEPFDAIEVCHSVAGGESHIRRVRVATPAER